VSLFFSLRKPGSIFSKFPLRRKKEFPEASDMGRVGRLIEYSVDDREMKELEPELAYDW
jgi:hypothetical protein